MPDLVSRKARQSTRIGSKFVIRGRDVAADFEVVLPRP